MGTESLHFSFDKPQPLILVISGLSGSGKDVVINRMNEISDAKTMVALLKTARRVGV